MKTKTLKKLTALVLSAVLLTASPVMASEMSDSAEPEIILADNDDDPGADDAAIADAADDLDTVITDAAGTDGESVDSSSGESNTDSDDIDPEAPGEDDLNDESGDDGDFISDDGSASEGEVTDGSAEETETPIPEAEEIPEEAPEAVDPEAEPAVDAEEPAEVLPEEEENQDTTALTALSFQDEALIALFNARMNVSDAALLARFGEVPGSLSAVTGSLPEQIGEDVDAMLRTYYAYTALDLTGAGTSFVYPEGMLDRWNAMKASMAGISVHAVIPSVDIMAVYTDGNLIRVETEEIYFVRGSGSDQSVLSYVFHNVFSFSADEETVILTGVQDYDSFYGSEEDYISMEVAASYTGGKYGVAESAMVEDAIQWALATAKDQTHGYSQAHRWGPDYDCSSFVISSFGHAGFNLGYMNWPNDDDHEDDLYYTGNLKQPFIDAGFTWIPASELGGLDTPTNLKRGDIVLREYHHTEIYIGNGYLVGAHGCESSEAHPNRSPATGDQADEVSVIKYTNYYGKGYDGVLRLLEEPDYATGSYTVTSAVNIRTGPATCYDIISVLPAGSLVKILEVRGKWGRFAANRWISLHCATPNLQKISIDKVTVSGVNSTYDFTNKAIKPAVTVRYNGQTLKKGTDYTVKYSGNKRPGTATITLTGDDVTLTGTRTIHFEIVPRAGTYLTTVAINLRAEANTGSTKLLQMPSGSYVYASNIKKVGKYYWAKTTFKGKTGWFFFGYGNYLTSKDIATGLVTNGTMDPAKTYMIVSADDPTYTLGTASIKPGRYAAFYKVNRSSERQRFRFTAGSDGAYMIESAYSEQALAPRGGSTAAGVNLNLQTPAATAIQSWKVRSNGDVTFSFINAATGRAFRCAGGSAAYKTAAETYTDTPSSAGQKFFLIEVSGVSNGYDGLYYIRKGTGQYVMMVRNKSLDVNAPLVLYKRTSVAAKKFRLVYSGGGYYRILASNTGYAVTIKDDSDDILTPLVMNDWKGTASQLWKPVANPDDTISFINPNGYAISLTGNKIANKTVIRIDSFDNKDAEKWTLRRIS